MKKGGIGGHLTKTGLQFEELVDIDKALGDLADYEIEGNKVIKNSKEIAEIHSKHELYRFLKEKGVDWEKILSKRLLPDIAVFVYASNIFYILEVKYQEVEGSTDEKLQTCDFKIKQYRKLIENTLGYKVRYVYVLNDWFKKEKYKDVLVYIKSIKGCDYLFNKVSNKYLGI